MTERRDAASKEVFTTAPCDPTVTDVQSAWGDRVTHADVVASREARVH